MKRSSSILTLWLGFAVINFLFSQNYFALFFLVISLLIIVYLASTIIFVRNQVTVQVEVPQQIVKNGATFAQIHIHNKASLSLGHVVCRVEWTHAITKQRKQEKIVLAVGRRSEVTVPVELPKTYCGPIQLELKQLRIYDAFTIFFTKIRTSAKSALSVLPAGFPTMVHIQEQYATASWSASALSVPMDGSEIVDYKPYAIGDNVKNIHWKLSSKLDELVLKQTEEYSQEKILVFVSLQETQCSIEQYDGILEALSAIVQALIKQDKTFELCWVEKDEQCYVIQSEEEFLACLTELMYMKSTNLHTEHKFYQHRSHYTNIIYITSDESAMTLGENVLLLLYGERTNSSQEIVLFTRENMQLQLEELYL